MITMIIAQECAQPTTAPHQAGQGSAGQGNANSVTDTMVVTSDTQEAA